MINQFEEMLEGITGLMIPTVTDENYCETLSDDSISIFVFLNKFFNKIKN